ncbi:MAG: hypothetical protein ACREDQ_13020, partial [Limisphaerales bacterium]
MQTPHPTESSPILSNLNKMLSAPGYRGLVLAVGLLAALATPMSTPAQTTASPKLTVVKSNCQFQLQLRGQSNQVYEIQASTDLTSWTTIAQR